MDGGLVCIKYVNSALQIWQEITQWRLVCFLRQDFSRLFTHAECQACGGGLVSPHPLVVLAKSSVRVNSWRGF